MKRMLLAFALLSVIVVPIMAFSSLNSANNPEPVNNDFLRYINFDVKTEGGFNIGIDKVAFCFADPEYSFSQNDFSGLAITKDGFPVSNAVAIEKASLDYAVEGYSAKYCALIEPALSEPGVYMLKGAFKGAPFKSSREILEKPGSKPADPAMLEQSRNNMGFIISQDKEHWELEGFSLGFQDRQEAFYMSDLTDLKITLRSVDSFGRISAESADLPAELEGGATRSVAFSYYSGGSDTAGLETSFSFKLKKPLSEPGEYFIQGLYQGKHFSNRYQMPSYEFQQE